MSAIRDFSAKQAAFNSRLETAVTGVQTDVKELTAKVKELQGTPGQITPEDQALLDQIEQRTAAVTSKLEALNALNPPEVPA